ncbi:MAG: class I SAM-dependent methyltransferase [Pyrinomonadaceae bacterium]
MNSYDRCAICRSEHSTALFSAFDRLEIAKEPFTIAKCSDCGVLRTLPAMSDYELSRYYPHDYWGDEPTAEPFLPRPTEQTKFLERSGMLGGRILDVGCGSGFFLRSLDPTLWDRMGVEIGREAAAVARKFIGNENIFESDFSSAKFGDAVFDIVTFWSSFEHLGNPTEALDETHRVLKPGGTLILQVPDAASYQARFFKGNWFSLDAPRHRYHYDFPFLKDLLASKGFDAYLSAGHSRTHDHHALRQSLKALLRHKSFFKDTLYLLTKSFTRPVDAALSLFDIGATITLAARKLGS